LHAVASCFIVVGLAVGLGVGLTVGRSSGDEHLDAAKKILDEVPLIDGYV